MFLAKNKKSADQYKNAAVRPKMRNVKKFVMAKNRNVKEFGNSPKMRNVKKFGVGHEK